MQREILPFSFVPGWALIGTNSFSFYLGWQRRGRKEKICKPVTIVEALSRDVCWLCTSAKISNEGRGNLLLLIKGRNSTNLIIYVDPSSSTNNQLLSASSAQELVGFIEQVGRMTWAPSPSLLLLMVCCHAAQKTPQREPIVKGKERKRGRWEGRREEGGEREEGRGRERRTGGRKEQLKTQLPPDIFRGSWCPYILKILIYSTTDSWKNKQILRKRSDSQKPLFSHHSTICIDITLPLAWMSCLHSDGSPVAREVHP